MNSKRRTWWFAMGIVVVAAGAALGAPTPVVLGHVMGAALEVDGVSVPSGATLVAPASLATGPTRAVVYLANETTVQLAEHSSVAFDAAPDGRIAIAVAAGSVSVGSPGGTMASYGAAAALMLDENGQAQVGEGAQVSRGKVALCELENTNASEISTCTADPRAAVCRWELIKVEASEVQSYLDRGARYQGQDGLDCRDRAAALFIPAAAAAAGMSSGAVAGIVAGSVLGAVVINDQVIDEDDEPSSP
ncbi:MAG: hypothetical protein ACRD0X_00565 [Thermoanaerobaculia bacterium]